MSRREAFARSGVAALTLGAALAGARGSAAAAAGARASRGAVWADATPPAAPDAHPRLPAGYFHLAFTVDTPEQVAQAAALGITHTICYAGTSWGAAGLSTTLGYAMRQHGLKTFLNVQNPFLSCSRGKGQLDLKGLRDVVRRYHQSPILAGYWTKDDDCGQEADAVSRMYREIRAIDPNPNHLIMPGFSDARSVYRNYRHGQGDLLGFYPYPAYSNGPAYEIPRMLRIVRARTPRGHKPPPFIGIYQAFGNPPRRPVPSARNILSQARTYLNYGALGLGAFGWEADIESHVIKNDPTLQKAVGAVSAYLRAHPARRR